MFYFSLDETSTFRRESKTPYKLLIKLVEVGSYNIFKPLLSLVIEVLMSYLAYNLYMVTL